MSTQVRSISDGAEMLMSRAKGKYVREEGDDEIYYPEYLIGCISASCC
jgi:hypothetical protein